MCCSGTCLSIDHENQLIILSFSVFNQECEQDFKYLNKHCVLSMPKGRLITNDIVNQMSFIFLIVDGHEITEALYQQHEEGQKDPAFTFSVGDSIYVKATAWKSSFYKNKWPYDVEMSMDYSKDLSICYHFRRSKYIRGKLSTQGIRFDITMHACVNLGLDPSYLNLLFPPCRTEELRYHATCTKILNWLRSNP